ncbi:splicing factor 3b subunit 2-like protein [Blastocystis sp. subtype 4]|uniref:splicing factor 3b subunit 2-like protein n=1 Tax=Blastocystis sp. subtype 4 TaxID=944170 RepID=UPI000711DC93|nr:splicing factor 3b subunit 2-like protein [Blastocystis sp. subtype 4]KNB42436.1 splicing factor 3b subunit 2-like protein [Blastocystis sp. subtype 4]|eukprot:XP_014525879.1 splicing factor 3b subunit 2-like protein [Blastocystis sp. subtype 4]
MNAGELEQPKKMSKKARKLASRLTVAELKQLVRRPDVVEVEDVTSADPRLLVYLKSYRNTVPVPRHWCSKRHYLQGRRGTEKTPFKLPDYIANTGISDIRASIAEEERDKGLQEQARDRMHPKLHRMDISYDVLEDAFFRHMTKPKMTGFGEVYYEGKEYEVRLTDRKPGQLSDRLREALGMTPLSPPPWLYMQQRYGPPPSYPNLRIPGLNSPIPPGCQYGNHLEGWGRPPVDELGRPLYGDVFGVYQEENAKPTVNPEEVALWGEVPDGPVEIPDESEPEQQQEQPEETLAASEEEPGMMSVIPGSETPAAIQLRKEAGDETPYEPRSLYTHLEEVKVSGEVCLS